MNKKANIISDILQNLYDNRVELSKNKFSGVYEIDGVYRTHLNRFVPRAWWTDDAEYKAIKLVVDINFHQTMEWDALSFWLTMKDQT